MCISRTGEKTHHTTLVQNCLVKGLTSGAKYWFRVRAVNGHGPGPWSNPASARVK
ncbi:MAG: fibronectin type III domain-containing protein [Pedosphaera sp.]|nr:fibronectin type III domain-containing protein [Pedosphaera sp.]